jgi:4-diphosphocytidyl-2-C-methyl-D-erythritol kinase
MILFPPAKINLGLRVLYKRPDNYHEIDSCMVPIPFYDVLEILPAEQFSFVQTGLIVDGDPESNLCVRAFRMMETRFAVPNVYLHLRKVIPMGAGLGGGSADAAYVLRGLRDLFLPELEDVVLEEMAAQLGSDCALFVGDSPRLASGRGEVLRSASLNLEGYFIKLINPGIHIGTAEAYSGIVFPTHPETIESVLSRPIDSWKEKLYNDFETSVFPAHPVLKAIKNKLYDEGAIYASMSGSGSTMYGIYSGEPALSFSAENYLEKIFRL